MIKCGENNNGKAMSVFILLESQCFAQRRRAAVDGGDVAALRLCRLLKSVVNCPAHTRRRSGLPGSPRRTASG